MIRNFKSYLIAFLSAFLCIVLTLGCNVSQNVNGSENAAASSVENDGVLKVNYIDVGQADSILIQSPNGKNMLIDAGETKENAVLNYLKGCGVKKLDVVVATHPHEDHISEMASVIKNFDIGTFYMPKKQHTTNSFEKMVDALGEKNVSVKEAKAGVSIDFDNDVLCNIVAPCKNNYDDLNNWSAVVKISYGNNKFIFTGDAESLSEKEIIASGADIKADVLKVGHHGSKSSTSEEFLKKVSPKYAVISAAKVNDYGHPHKETISVLNKYNVKTFGTYDYGNIVAVSDGNEIKFNVGEETSQKSESAEPQQNNNTADNSKTETVYAQFIGNKNSKKFHLPICSGLPAEKNRVIFNSRTEAVNNGYSPCGKCNP